MLYTFSRPCEFSTRCSSFLPSLDTTMPCNMGLMAPIKSLRKGMWHKHCTKSIMRRHLNRFFYDQWVMMRRNDANLITLWFSRRHLKPSQGSAHGKDLFVIVSGFKKNRNTFYYLQIISFSLVLFIAATRRCSHLVAISDNNMRNFMAYCSDL